MHNYITIPLMESEEMAVRVICAETIRNEIPDTEDCMKEDREYFSRYAVLPQQTHSVNVGVIENDRYGGVFPETDALISFNPVVAVGVVTADCVPIMIYAPDIKGIAAIHAGWKGTIGGIVDNVMGVLISRGASPDDMTVAFGPSISAGAYEVSHELAERFIDSGFGKCVIYPERNNGNPHIDLQEVNVMRLMNAGVKEENIRRSEIFTDSAVDDKGNRIFPSYRRDGGTSLRLLTYITMF